MIDNIHSFIIHSLNLLSLSLHVTITSSYLGWYLGISQRSKHLFAIVQSKAPKFEEITVCPIRNVDDAIASCWRLSWDTLYFLFVSTPLSFFTLLCLCCSTTATKGAMHIRSHHRKDYLLQAIFSFCNMNLKDLLDYCLKIKKKSIRY